jgi:methyl-CpG-binding domain protein 4
MVLGLYSSVFSTGKGASVLPHLDEKEAMISIPHYVQGFKMIADYDACPRSTMKAVPKTRNAQIPVLSHTPQRATRSRDCTLVSCTRRSPVKSPHFQKVAVAKQAQLEKRESSCVILPPLKAKGYGLIQERLHNDPFQLLIAVVFLNKTKGVHALPVFFALMEQYPTPQALAAAPLKEIVETIRHLGLQNQRAKKLKGIAQTWIDNPPDRARRYRTLNYPNHGDGKEIKVGETLSEDDERQGGLEIAHIPGLSRYAWDSWRIFCRDKLRGQAEDYKGTGAATATFEPEWKRVLPEDKELRPCLRWMWLKEGWHWNPLTGEKRRVLEEELMKQESRTD